MEAAEVSLRDAAEGGSQPEVGQMRTNISSTAARQARLAWGVCLLVIALVLVKIPLLVPCSAAAP